MVPRNETDVVLASLAFNLDRDEVIDYTIPVFPRITLTLWQPLGNRSPLNYTAFIDVFPMAKYLASLQLPLYQVEQGELLTKPRG